MKTDARQPAADDARDAADGSVRHGSLRGMPARRRLRRAEWLALVIAIALHAVAFALMPGPLNNALRSAPEILLSLNLQQPDAVSSQETHEVSVVPDPPVEAEQRSARKDEHPAVGGPSVDWPLQRPPGNTEAGKSALQPVAASESQSEPDAAKPDPSQFWAELGGALELRDAADAPAEADQPPVDSEPADAESAVEPAAESPAPALDADVDLEALLREYTTGIRRLIEARKFYPAQAERLGHHGTVKVGFTIGAEGDVSGIYVKEGSGFGALDAAALEAVRRAARFPAIPPELERESLALSVSLKYSLR